ncbi:hypothetical protein NG799_26370 [Laspinema sp. D1]|uniref:Aquaporin Z n=1 Tax=Laspinema palackyanum D2a TaxID=2953684 RepID=A0ABT2MYM2_9CYAN|nr:hypothetical protein [Laspinema sp. D2a]
MPPGLSQLVSVLIAVGANWIYLAVAIALQEPNRLNPAVAIAYGIAGDVRHHWQGATD